MCILYLLAYVCVWASLPLQMQVSDYDHFLLRTTSGCAVCCAFGVMFIYAVQESANQSIVRSTSLLRHQRGVQEISDLLSLSSTAPGAVSLSFAASSHVPAFCGCLALHWHHFIIVPWDCSSRCPVESPPLVKSLFCVCSTMYYLWCCMSASLPHWPRCF